MKMFKIVFLSCCLIFLSQAIFAQDVPQTKVSFEKNSEGFWRVSIGDKAIPIRGAGGVLTPGMLEEFSAVGGNFTRTWSIETLEQKVSDGKRYVDLAQELGVHIMAGLWIGHERHGFNYSNKEQLEKQREAVRQAVRKWKNHPAIAIWGLGNEMEGPQAAKGNPVVWQELEILAKIIHEEDPSRPVMTVIAGASEGKIKSLLQYCPSMDAVGINAYGSAGGVGEALIRLGWNKPFAITEFGVKGFWEVPATPWGAPYEPNSTEKARSYFATHKMVTELNTGKELCLGTFAFLWGWKQEKTSTWFGMYLNTKEKLPQVDALVKAWTGKWPANRSPSIESVTATFLGKTVGLNTKLTARVIAEDKDGDELKYEWLVVQESQHQSVGGDTELVPPSYPELTLLNAEECTFMTPSKAGAYRLFLTIRDGKGNAATANIPFLVK
jgi:hypothetical protein